MIKLEIGKRIDPQDYSILVAAEVLLEPNQPDRFDLDKLSKISGLNRKIILGRFPFPELLTLGVMVMSRQGSNDCLTETQTIRLCPQNGQELLARGWEPEVGLISFFAEHPLVKLYLVGETPVRSWFRKSRKVC